MRVHDLLLEDVGLVEKKYDRGALEPGISNDGLEQGFALLHAVLNESCSNETGVKDTKSES